MRNIYLLFFIICFVLAGETGLSQSLAVNTDGSAANASALLVEGISAPAEAVNLDNAPFSRFFFNSARGKYNNLRNAKIKRVFYC